MLLVLIIVAIFFVQSYINIKGNDKMPVPDITIAAMPTYATIKGTTIHGIYPEEGIPLILNPIAIMNQTEHPEEAKRFMDFLLSKEGQELVQRLSYKYSVREDVSPLEGEPPLGGLNILNPENETDYLAKRGVYSQEFSNFMGENI